MEIVDDRAWVEIATWTSPTPNGRFRSLSFTRNQFGSEGDHGKMPAPCSTGFFGCCAWHDLPDRYPPYQTYHRRFQQWQRDGTLTRLLHALAEDLRARGKLDLSETFIDASFSSAKKGALLSARLAEEKAVKSWRSQTAMVFLSPATSPALRRMKRNSSKAPSNTVSPVLGRNE